MPIKLNEQILYENKVTSINELDKLGYIEYVEREKESRRSTSGSVIKYYAKIKDKDLIIEINKTAYKSKIGKKFDEEVNKCIINDIEITKEALKSYNNHIELSGNENVNKYKKIGSLDERSILNKIGSYFYGCDILNGQVHRLTFHDIDIYKRRHHN